MRLGGIWASVAAQMQDSMLTVVATLMQDAMLIRLRLLCVGPQRLFHCSPNCGHLLRPDKVLEGMLTSDSQSSKSRSTTASPSSSAPSPSVLRPAIARPSRRGGAPPSNGRSSSDEEESAAPRPSSTTYSPPRADRSEDDQEVMIPRARSFSPVRRSGVEPVLVTKKDENKRYEKWRGIDPAKVIGTDPQLDEILPRHRTGLVYDTRMEAHCSPVPGFHPEQPLRITAIFAALADQGLAQKCCRVPARFATGSELESVHTAEHVQNMCNLGKKTQKELSDIAAALNSVYLCPQSSDAALLASGSVVEATRMVCQGKIARACCVVRPPGHHALPSCAMGFCLFGESAPGSLVLSVCSLLPVYLSWYGVLAASLSALCSYGGWICRKCGSGSQGGTQARLGAACIDF